MLGTICVTLLDKLYRMVGHPLTIVETGTTYLTVTERGEKDLSERSTIAITHWMKRTNHSHVFHSIDIDRGHQIRCGDKLRELGLGSQSKDSSIDPEAPQVWFHTGKGVTILDGFDFPIDFVLLDADSNASATLAEYSMVYPLVRDPGIIVVDDAFKDASVNKARMVLPTAEMFGHYWQGFCKQAAAIAIGSRAEKLLKETNL